jgi:(p)ppGpp synthase/HD superfamily hydrolase
MSERTTTTLLGEAFSRALMFAADKHGTQVRKGGGATPYLGHLLSVAGLVIEAGGTENQAIAALLHDAVEDAENDDGDIVLAEIRREFGDEVAGIVDECSDTDEKPKPAWKPRKQKYIDHLADASDGAVLVSLADKLDNARAILRDLRQHGDVLWQRFTVKDPAEHLWYYGSLLQTFKKKRPGCPMVDELDRVVAAWRTELSA